MAFLRLNALSYWLLPIAGLMMLASFISPGGGFAAGWTCTAPSARISPGTCSSTWACRAGASSILTALNFLVTIITMRAPGMTFWRMLLPCGRTTTSLLVVIATPFIAGSQFFAMFDRLMHTNFFEPSGGYLGYQHIFWFYSHPAVYIMMLPGFGIASEVISTMSAEADLRLPADGAVADGDPRARVLRLGAPHVRVGMATWLRVPMMVTTLAIAVPTGIKVFSWLATLWEGRIHFETPMLFAPASCRCS